MNTTKKEAFKIIGISVRTTNENGQAATDIQALWSRFFTENIPAKITNKLSDEIYSVYTDYEKDHTKPYTTILGYKVNDNEPVPAGMVEKRIDGATYRIFTAKGKASENFVFRAWQNIWSSDADRSYTADFEVYGAGSQDPENAEVNIFIALN
jgi:predicted transcriptional regulator YdeE